MLQLARTIVGVAFDVLRLVVSFLRPSSAIRADNLVLRKQLASYIERGIKPRRADHVTRVALALFTRMFDWRARTQSLSSDRQNRVCVNYCGPQSPDALALRRGTDQAGWDKQSTWSRLLPKGWLL